MKLLCVGKVKHKDMCILGKYIEVAQDKLTEDKILFKKLRQFPDLYDEKLYCNPPKEL